MSMFISAASQAVKRTVEAVYPAAVFAGHSIRRVGAFTISACATVGQVLATAPIVNVVAIGVIAWSVSYHFFTSNPHPTSWQVVHAYSNCLEECRERYVGYPLDDCVSYCWNTYVYPFL